MKIKEAEGGTALECFLADHGELHFGREVDGCEGRAAQEGPFPDAGEAGGEGADLYEGGAADEASVAYGNESGGKGDLGK